MATRTQSIKRTSRPRSLGSLLLTALVLIVAGCTGGGSTATETTAEATTSRETTTTAETTTTTEAPETTSTTLEERPDLLQWAQPGTPEAKVETVFWLSIEERFKSLQSPRNPERPELTRYAGGAVLDGIRANRDALAELNMEWSDSNSLYLIYEINIDGDTATVEYCEASSVKQITTDTREVVKIYDGISRWIVNAEVVDGNWKVTEGIPIEGFGSPDPATGSFGCINDFAPDMITPEYSNSTGEE